MTDAQAHLGSLIGLVVTAGCGEWQPHCSIRNKGAKCQPRLTSMNRLRNGAPLYTSVATSSLPFCRSAASASRNASPAALFRRI